MHLLSETAANDFSENSGNNDTDKLIEVDLSNGNRTILFEDTIGSGPQIDSAAGSFFAETSNSVYTVDLSNAALIQIDLSSNTRTIISSDNIGTGPSIADPKNLTVDAVNGLAYILESDRIIEVELSTGIRRPLSDSVTGSGPAFGVLEDVTLQSSMNRLLVTDSSQAAVIAVDTATGDRTVISDSSHNGDVFLKPLGIDYDEMSGLLLVSDGGSGSTMTVRLFSVDLDSGDRSVISSYTQGSGPFLNGANDVEIIPGLLKAMVANSSTGYLVDLATGDRRSVIGNGEILRSLNKISFDTQSLVAYGFSNEYEALFAIEIESGDHVVVSK